MRRPRHLLLMLGALLAVAGCASLRPKAPTSPLRWTLDADTPVALGWGEVARIDASEALQSDRLLVVRGAELLQHAQFRWYARPAQMLDERLRWQGGAAPPAPLLDGAKLDLFVHAFELRVDAAGQASARVALSAVMHCPVRYAAASVELGATEQDVALNDQAAQRLTDGFAAATDAALATLATRARQAAMRCAQATEAAAATVADRDADRASP